MTSDYEAFLAKKAQDESGIGFEPEWMPDFLFPFQRFLVTWNLARGRSASFADTGLGKTAMQLVWAENVRLKMNRRVLILAPLAVTAQTVREARKFGIECERSRDGRIDDAPGIVVTNYEKLHLFSPADFAAVVCDESSCLKSWNAARRAAVTEFMRTIPYRLLCTATAAPNDYIELGTSSEALGYLGHMDMLNRFFVNDQNNSSTKRAWAGQGGGAPKWRFKGHGQEPFWRWVSSWARACRRPSDLGFSDEGFVLPPLTEREHVVRACTLAPGMLFPMTAQGLSEEREERRRTLRERCEKVAELVDHEEPAVVWCHLNDEGDLLEEMIPGATQVKGANSDEEKEERYEAFASGEARVLVLKPKIGAWGLNWQHCAHVITFASHSHEQDYQSIRRCWRFGQKRSVIVDRVSTEGEAGIRENMRRKSDAADAMFTALVRYMNDAIRIDRDRSAKSPVEVPAWL